MRFGKIIKIYLSILNYCIRELDSLMEKNRWRNCGFTENLCWIISYFSRPLLSKYRILCNFHKLYIFIDSKLFIKNCKEIKNLIFHRIICNNKILHKKLMQSIFLLKYSTLNEILLHTRNRSQQWFLCSFLFVW